MAYSQAWLEDPSAIRGLFAVITVYDVVAGQNVTKYVSTIGYVSENGTVSFSPIIVGGAQLTESLSLDGQATLSFGDIELDNTSGELDSWLDNTKYIWSNRSISLYYADPTWPYAEVVSTESRVFSGIIDDIDSRDVNSINIKIRDKLERLNAPITENKLGTYGSWGSNAQSNKESIRPIVFGEVHNIQPMLINPGTLEYLVSDGTISVNITSITGGDTLVCNSTTDLTVGQPIFINPVTSDNTTSSNNITYGADTSGLSYYVVYSKSGNQFKLALRTSPSVLLTSFTNGTCNLVGSMNKFSTEYIIEIRDSGIPIYDPETSASGATVASDKCTFKLTKTPAGTITASVQGITNTINLSTGAFLTGQYTNNIASLIALIVTSYGKVENRFSTGSTELDLANLQAFSAAHPQTVGLYISDRTNMLVACQELARSVGAQIYVNRQGQLQILKIATPTGTPSVSITTADILHNTLSIVNRTGVRSAVKIGYCKNYTVQQGLLTSIPSGHKDSYETEWYSKIYVNQETKSKYNQGTDPEQVDTLLISGTDALAEASRIQTYYNVPRTVYSFTGTPRLLSLTLGQGVTLTYPRFGLENGKTGQVIGLTPNWLKSTVDIEVIV